MGEGDRALSLRGRPHAHRALPWLAAVALVLTGFALCRDYGVPWDEQIQRGYGQIVARYVLRGDAALFQHADRVYGPAHELLLLAAETLSGARDMPDVVAVRHLVNFLTFVLGLGALFGLGRAGLGTPWAGALACLALVLSPVIFAHAFFNSKDVPFLAMFIVSIYTLVRFMERPGVVRALGHATACAWLVAIRVPGIVVVAFTAAAVVHGAFSTARGEHRKRLVGGFAVYVAVTIVLTWALWPTLWRDPWGSFWHALQTMGRFPWDGEVLFGGHVMKATDLPWYYAPVWIAITTPVLYLIGFLIGLPITLRRAFGELRRPCPDGGLFSVLLLSWLFVPLGSVVVFRSVLYDGWRQLFFVYPALLLIAVVGFQAVWRAIRDPAWGRAGHVAGVLAIVLALVNVAALVRFMIEAHPFQHVFFNRLVGGLAGARFKYDLDYWGLAYRQGLEAIVGTDPDAVIAVLDMEGPLRENARILPYADRHRLVFVDSPEQAKYALVGSRLERAEHRYRDVIHRVEAAGVPILTVAMLNREASLTPATAPGVMAVRARNEALTANSDEPDLRTRVEAGLRASLARFVRNAHMLHIETSSARPGDLRSGRLDRLRLEIVGAEVGDFLSGGPGFPLAKLELTLGDVILDLARLEAGQFTPVLVETVTIDALVLDATAINAAMALAGGRERNLCVYFEDGRVRVESIASPRGTATLRLSLAPEARKPGSDNLWFTVETIRLSGWRVPVAWLLQLAVGRFSPAIDADEVTATVSLGRLEVGRQQLRLGTSVGTSR